MDWTAAMHALGIALAVIGLGGAFASSIAVSFETYVDGASRKLWSLPAGLGLVGILGVVLAAGLA